MNAYIGTELKFSILIKGDDFTMSDDNFTVTLYTNRASLAFDKTDLAVDSDGTYWVHFDTSDLSTGPLYCKTVAYVPDDMFEDGYRTEIDVKRIGTIKTAPWA